MTKEVKTGAAPVSKYAAKKAARAKANAEEIINADMNNEVQQAVKNGEAIPVIDTTPSPAPSPTQLQQKDKKDKKDREN